MKLLGFSNQSFINIAGSEVGNINDILHSILGHLPPDFAEEILPMLQQLVEDIVQENPGIDMDGLMEVLESRVDSLIEQGPSESAMSNMVEEEDQDVNLVDLFKSDELTEDQATEWDRLWPDTR